MLACIGACSPQSRQAEIADSFAPAPRSLSAGALAGLPREVATGIGGADEARIQLIGARLLEAAAIYCGWPDPLKGSSGPDCNISFALINGSEINAFLDRHGIRVIRGMVKFARGDAELAFAIAHEVPHGLLHVGKSTLSGSRRELEYEADHLGLHLVARAGFAPELATGLIRRLAASPGEGRLHPNYPTFGARLRKLLDIAPDIERGRASGYGMAPEPFRRRFETIDLNS